MYIYSVQLRTISSLFRCHSTITCQMTIWPYYLDSYLFCFVLTSRNRISLIMSNYYYFTVMLCVNYRSTRLRGLQFVRLLLVWSWFVSLFLSPNIKQLFYLSRMSEALGSSRDFIWIVLFVFQTICTPFYSANSLLSMLLHWQHGIFNFLFK